MVPAKDAILFKAYFSASGASADQNKGIWRFYLYEEDGNRHSTIDDE
jgi:hypothetical protein